MYSSNDSNTSLWVNVTLCIVILAALILPTFCTNEGRNTLKHWESSYIGLKRKVTLYDANGKPLKSWTTDSKVEDKGGSYFFLDENGKAQRISGTVVIEEL